MTPPKTKPKASVRDASADEQAAAQTETPSIRDHDAAPAAVVSGASTGASTGTRRRSAALEVRVGRRRGGSSASPASETDAGEAGLAKVSTRPARGEGLRAARAADPTGTRTGTRAQQRAARAGAAEAEAEAEAVQPGPVAEPASDAVDATRPDGDQTEAVMSDMPAPPSAPVRDAVVAAPPQTVPVAIPQTVPVVEPSEDDDEDDDRGPGQGGRRRGARAEKRGNRATKNDASNYVVASTANPAQMRARHYGVIAAFLLFVVVPTISYSWYLWTLSADQYESDVGFGSRTEEVASTFDFLGALGGTTQSGSKDMDILNQFIISQELVAKVDAQVDLEAMYTKPTQDPLNAFHPDGTIEDLVKYWERMVLVNYDNGTGLMNLQVFAFDPVDARKIAEVVMVESTRIINELSQTAQEDTTRYSKEALAATEAKLTEARLAVLDFQVRNNIVDPSNVIANQLSVVSTLNQQLAGAQIELDMITGTVPATDPRIAQLNRRIEVIRNRIAEEQSKVGAASDSSSPGFAKLTADFERLKVDQDFAQQAYLSALAAHDQALTDAQHKTRYLATYVAPTLAEAPTAPNRPMTAFLVALIGFLTWAVVVLVYYALRDRR